MSEQTQTKALTKFEQVKIVLRSDEAVNRFAEVLGDRNARAYISSVITAVAMNDALQECSPATIMTAAMRAASLRLTVDPSLGQAHIVPFKGSATFVIGYKGLEQLALRTGKYRYINVATIYNGQTVVENQLKGVHSIQGLPTNRVPIGYMLYFELKDGYAKTFYMTVEEIDEHAKRYSKSYGNKTSPWTTHFPEMCKKTVMRLGLSRWGYFDPNDAMLMAATDEQEPEGDTVDAEWMDKAVEAEMNKPPATEAELMGALGFGDAPSKPTPPPAPEVPAELLEAEAEMSGTYHAPYGQLETDVLSKMHLGLKRAKTALTEEQTRKMHALEIVLKARASGRPVIVPDAPEAQGELL